MGAEFDVLINLDGFNEAVLPITENIPYETAAAYPQLVNGGRQQDGAEFTRMAGYASYLRMTQRDEAQVRRTPLVLFSHSESDLAIPYESIETGYRQPCGSNESDGSRKASHTVRRGRHSILNPKKKSTRTALISGAALQNSCISCVV